MSFDAVPDNSLLTRLRQATGPQHEAVEALLKLDGEIAGPHYRRVLAGFALFLSAWEPAVRAALPGDLQDWFDARSRLGFLRQDLQALAVASPPASVGIVGALAIATPAEALGSMYVLEGSALGGQLIARTVARTLGLTPQAGAAYFHGWGERTGDNWRAFRQVLEQRVPQADHQDAADAAVRTFEALRATFRPLVTA
jgi:heme oxygenase